MYQQSKFRMFRADWFAVVVAVALGVSTSARADLDDIDAKPEPTPLPTKASTPASKPSKQSSASAPSGAPATPTTAPAGSAKTKPGAKSDGKKPAKNDDQAKRREPVQLKSKGLRGTKDKGVVELSEDVVVTQGDLQLKANHAKVYFDEKADEVTQVVVTGNVKVTKASDDPKDRIVANGNEGVFYNSERKVTLKGNAQLKRGDDVIKGKQITYELETGWVSVDTVEGVMQPGEKGTEKKK